MEGCEIYIDEEGEWYHRGNRLTRPEIIEVLYSKLDQSLDGSFVLSSNNETCALDVADTPFVVTRVDREVNDSGEERIALKLKHLPANEYLEPETLLISRDNVLYCRVFNRRFPARFSRPAYYQLAEFVMEEPAGEEFYLEVNGTKHFIRSGNIPEGPR